MKEYKNPVIPGYHPDPSVCRVGDDYYLVTSTFEFFPGVPVFHSQNLVDWQCIGHCLTRKEQLQLDGCRPSSGIYAPTIRYHNGVFYMVTTNVHLNKHFYVYTRDIRGEWSDPVYVDQGGIDPSLLFDQGKVYFCSTGMDKTDRQCIYQCEIDIATGKKLTESTIISYGSGGKYPEAPHMYKIGDWYYLLLAEGGTEYGHMVTMFRSKSPWGPFEGCPDNPILTHRDAQGNRIQATGHADIIQDQKGDWWLFCLGFRTNPNGLLHHMGRETYLTPVTWTKDGWLQVGDEGVIHETMQANLPGPDPQQNKLSIQDSLCGELDIRWTSVRKPVSECAFVDPEGLHLKGTEQSLSTPNGSPAFAGIRQGAFNCDTTVMVKRPDVHGAKTGITVFYNNDYHYDLYMINQNGKLSVYFSKKVHDMETVIYGLPIAADQAGDLKHDGIKVFGNEAMPAGQNQEAEIKADNEAVTSDRQFCQLRILASDTMYQFFYREQGADWILMGSGLTAGLSSETTHIHSFTGVFIGLFSEGGEGVFRDFTMQEI